MGILLFLICNDTSETKRTYIKAICNLQSTMVLPVIFVMFGIYLVLSTSLLCLFTRYYQFNIKVFIYFMSSKWNVFILKFFSQHVTKKKWPFHLNPLAYKVCLCIVYTQTVGTLKKKSLFAQLLYLNSCAKLGLDPYAEKH